MPSRNDIYGIQTYIYMYICIYTNAANMHHHMYVKQLHTCASVVPRL